MAKKDKTRCLGGYVAMVNGRKKCSGEQDRTADLRVMNPTL